MRPCWMKLLGTAFLLWLSVCAFAKPIYYKAQSVEKLGEGTQSRIEAIAATMEDQPNGFAVHIERRPFWEAIAAGENGKSIVRRAQSLLEKPMPVLTDELYLLYSLNGNRTEAQNVMFSREDRLVTLCLAECIENKGRFTKALEEVLDSSVSYRTWVYPAHDGNLNNFNGKSVTIDLKSSRDAHNFAICLAMLKGKLSPSLADKTAARIHELVLAPYVRDIFDEEGGAENWWKTTTNNWNSVCHAGVAGAALTMLDDKRDRALFIERAEYYTDFYYKGFSADGYCSEGLGYWNYGFGQYIVLSEVIRSATVGKIDLFSNPKGLAAALYPCRVEIMNKQYPTLADCSLGTRPDAAMMGYVNTRLGLGDARWPLKKDSSGRGSLFEFLMFAEMDDAGPALKPPFAPDHDQLRTFFEDAGVLICRPAKGGSFAAVFKGGHNAEHHNHNDLGTFIVQIDDQQVILDPGSTEYTRTTFSKDRYTIRKIASYGHPVPVVAGKQQAEGRQAQAKILRQEFTAEMDTITMDLASAYPVAELTKLERTFVYSRKDAGSLEITDIVEFAEPNTFETALITYGTYKQTGPKTLEIEYNGKNAIAEIKSGENEVKIGDEVIESTKGSPRRIAIQFAKPVKKGQISIRIWSK